MGKHHGAFIGLAIIIFGGIFGYFLGQQSPALVTGTVNVSTDAAPLVGGLLVAATAALVWGVGELLSLGVATLFGLVERRIVVFRLGFSLIGSLGSVVTSALQVLGVTRANPDPHSLFAYLPIITGLGAAALGAHALVHQIRLNRELR